MGAWWGYAATDSVLRGSLTPCFEKAASNVIRCLASGRDWVGWGLSWEQAGLIFVGFVVASLVWAPVVAWLSWNLWRSPAPAQSERVQVNLHHSVHPTAVQPQDAVRDLRLRRLRRGGGTLA